MLSGLFLSILVATLKSGSDLAYKLAGKKVSDDKVLVFIQRLTEGGIALAVILFAYFLFDHKFGDYLSYIFNLKFIFLTFVATALGSAALFMNIRALRLGELSVISPLSQLTPAILLVTSPIMVGDEVSSGGVLGVLMVVFGSYVLGIREEEGRHNLLKPIQNIFRDKGVKYALAASCIYAITGNMDKTLTKMSDPFSYTFLVGFFTVTIFYIILRYEKYHLARLTISQIGSSMVPGVTGAAGSIVQLYAISIWQVPYVLAIKRMSSIVSVLIGLFYFKENNPFFKILGAVIMLSGSLLIILLG